MMENWNWNWNWNWDWNFPSGDEQGETGVFVG